MSDKPPGWVDDKFKSVQAADVDDLHCLPGEFRAFRSEMRDSLDAIARALQSLGRIEARLDVVIDRQNTLDARIADVEKRVTALEQRRPTAAKRK